MYIREVVVDGFKSYATRTVLHGFDPHFNAITGLNGSGKSNILDSICFVLGISNLSQVRVGNLQELVYKQGQAGVTKASVTLVFSNVDKKSSPMGYESFDEVTITRQVVIGGKNKYLINGRTVQQSQVTNLFHSVQLNVNNPHFLIMQGRITKVLNMKPPEILGMIEEAAGTRMFEHKKQNALKTIQKKQVKVDEIDTILKEEITPTLERLRGEKTFYLRWSANKTEEERLQRFCVAYEYSSAEASLANADEEFQGMERQRATLEQAQEAAAEAVSMAETKAKDVQALRDGEVDKAVKEATAAREQLSKELVQATSELSNKKTALNNELKALETLKKSEEESGALITAKEAAIAEQVKAVAEAEHGVKEAEEAHSKLQAEYQGMCAGVATEKEESRTLTDQIAALAAEVTSSKAREKQGAARIKHLKATAKSTEKEMKAAEKQVSQLRKDRDAAEARVGGVERSLESLGYDESQADGLAQEKEVEEKAVDSLRETVHNLSAQVTGRLSFEFSDPERGFNRARVKGLVARLVSVRDPLHSTALEVAAGGKLYQVVVDTEQTAKLLVQRGKLRRRVTIIPLNRISSYPLKSNQLSRASSIAGRMNGWASCAIELVGYDRELRDAMSYVFGSTIVCDSLEVAKQVAFDKGVRARTVTLEGDSFEPQGTLTGGSNTQLGVILARLGELQSATRDLGAHEERLRAIDDKIGRLAEASRKFSELSRELELRKHELGMLAERLGQSSHSQLETKLKETNSALEEEVAAVENARTACAAAVEKGEKLKAKEASFREAREKMLEDLERRVKGAKSALGKASATLKEQKRAAQVLEMELEQLVEAGSSQADQRRTTEKALGTARETVEKLEDVAKEKSTLYTEADGKLHELKEEQARHDATLKALKKDRESAAKALKSAEQDLKKIKKRLEQFQKERQQSENFMRNMETQYMWIKDEKQYFGRPQTDYDFSSRDPAAAQSRLKQIKEEQASLSKKINKKVMGMIEKAEDEYRVLIHKKQVVENDKTKIKTVIDELDQKKNQALQSTWIKVNRDFGSIFSTLLPGTSAKLQPPEGASVMEGLEVKVAFGSVWKETLTELSGGQRSLLALSLILSLLLFKPAPMYILDEVDAALDLSHTQNIGTMLKTHFSASQFIVVSLKEGMFNNANVIFRTKFVDGVSTVSRTANRSAISGKPGAESSGNVGMQKSAAWKRGKTVSGQAASSRRREENLEED